MDGSAWATTSASRRFPPQRRTRSKSSGPRRARSSVASQSPRDVVGTSASHALLRAGSSAARRGGSAWGSVGLIGFCRAFDHGAPEASGGRGSKSRPRHHRSAEFPGNILPVDRTSGDGMQPGSGPTSAASGGTLFGLRGSQLRRLGVALLVIGFVVFIGSIAQLFGAFANVGSDPFGSFGSVVQSFFFAFVGSIAGMLLIGLGG